MSKITTEQKIEIYQKRKAGVFIQKLSLKYKVIKENNRNIQEFYFPDV